MGRRPAVRCQLANLPAGKCQSEWPTISEAEEDSDSGIDVTYTAKRGDEHRVHVEVGHLTDGHNRAQGLNGLVVPAELRLEGGALDLGSHQTRVESMELVAPTQCVFELPELVVLCDEQAQSFDLGRL